MIIRLQKLLADTGLASRRKCEKIILEGRISVNGKTVKELGCKVDTDKDEVKCDEEIVKIEKPVYLILNKPRGYVCSSKPLREQKSVLELVRGFSQRVFTVGRLDKDSEGLIVLTNDGELTQYLTHPRNRVPKIYLVTVGGKISKELKSELRQPVWTSAGKMNLEQVRVISSTNRRSELEILIREGKNREIRRFLAAKGIKVRRLIRVAIGPLKLGDLPSGSYRKLNNIEIEELRKAGNKLFE